MEAMALQLESAYERLYRWTQSKDLNLCMGDSEGQFVVVEHG